MKVLSLIVKLETTVCSKWTQYCLNKYLQMPNPGDPDGWHESRERILKGAINDAFTRLGKIYYDRTIYLFPYPFVIKLVSVEPLYCRKIRYQLTSSGNQAAVKMFSRNMKSLLLTPALGNFAVLGIDPST